MRNICATRWVVSPPLSFKAILRLRALKVASRNMNFASNKLFTLANYWRILRSVPEQRSMETLLKLLSRTFIAAMFLALCAGQAQAYPADYVDIDLPMQFLGDGESGYE